MAYVVVVASKTRELFQRDGGSAPPAGTRPAGKPKCGPIITAEGKEREAGARAAAEEQGDPASEDQRKEEV